MSSWSAYNGRPQITVSPTGPENGLDDRSYGHRSGYGVDNRAYSNGPYDGMDNRSFSGRSTNSLERSPYITAPGEEFWEAARRTPLRWHPEYASSDGLPRPSSLPGGGLETIVEDMPTPSRLGVPEMMYGGGGTPSVHSDSARPFNYLNFSTPPSLTNQHRRHSEGDLLELRSSGRYNKRAQNATNNGGGRRSSRQENDRPETSRRRKSLTSGDSPSDLDAFSISGASDLPSMKSGRSKLSTLSDESITSAGKLAANTRRRSEADTNSMRKNSSTVSLVRNEARRKSSVGIESIASAGKRSSLTNGVNSSKPRSERRTSALTLGGEAGDPTPFATLEIPVELLETPTSRVRKLMAPVIMFILVVTLLASLAIAVYFAVVLKDSQDQHIASLKFALEQDSQSRDFSRLTPAERQELEAAYCRQVDNLYKGSQLYSSYRGCQVESLTNQRIEFKLYFLDSLDSSTSAQEEEIIEVLASRAQQVGEEGSKLRKINDVTLDISQETRQVEVVVTKKPENFYATESASAPQSPQSATDTHDSIKQASSPQSENKQAQIRKTTASPPSSFTTVNDKQGHSDNTTVSDETTGGDKQGHSDNTTVGETQGDSDVTTVSNDATTATRFESSTGMENTGYSHDTTTATTYESSTEMENTVLKDDICLSIHPAQIVANPTDCTHYIQCEFLKPIVRPCSGGLVFDPDNLVCVKPSPDLPCTTVEPCENINGGHFAHPHNCKLFIICDQGKTVVQSCTGDMVWDDNSKNCLPRKRGTDCTPV